MYIPSTTARHARRALCIALGTGVTIAVPNARASAQGARDVDSASVAPGIRVPGALVGASRAIVDSSDVRRAAALTFSELMQARAASVNVSMSGGRPVDGGQFLVRGPSTIASEGVPIVIVDGMRMMDDEDDAVSTVTRLDDIAIDDIASVEVLRGPSAAALYGAGASAGVIVVTTKRGNAGPLRGHVRAVAEGSQDAGHYIDRFRRRPVGSTTSFSCTLSAQAAGTCTPGPLERWNPLTEGNVFRAGMGAAAALDLEGGTRASDARLSTTIRHANGISRGDGIGHLASRLNATHRIGERLDVTGRVAYTNDQTSGSLLGDLIGDVPYSSVGATPLDAFAQWANFELSEPAIDGRLDHFTAGGELAARVTRWLTLRAAASTDKVSEGAERINRNPALNSTDPNNLYLQGPPEDQQHIRTSLDNKQRSVRATAELTLPVPASLRGSALLILGAEHERRDRFYKTSEGFGPGTMDSWETMKRWSTNPAQFILGRLAIADRVAFAAGARRENESYTDSKWHIYPMADVAIRPAGRVAGGQMRLRGAFGESAQRMAMSSDVMSAVAPPVIYFGPAPPALPTPERMKELEGGFDLEWGTAGALSATYYHRTISNVVFGQPARFGGVNLSVLDLASHGVELDTRAMVLQRGALSWSLRGIVATNTNRVMTDSVSTTPGGAALVTGYPVGVAQRLRYTVNDANGNGVFDAGEVVLGSGFERFGGSTPTLTLALHSELRIGRRLSLTGVVDRRSGAWTLSSYAGKSCAIPEYSCRQYQDQSTSVADQAAAWFDAFYASNNPAAFDASFTRLRELSLRWTLKPGSARVGGSSAMQIVLSGRNLATWTQWPGSDPEINSLGRDSITRNDATAVPLPRRVMLGVEVGY
ncbi:MAG TPA: TonB-dependent receptor plug domain-containing protein [Gemmatimonadaceae bacterium]